MINVLLLKTELWELTVRTRDISRQQRQLSQTLKLRQQSLPESLVSFSSAVNINEVTELDCRYSPLGKQQQTLTLSQPLFFENTHYQFDFVFPDTLDLSASKQPAVLHDLLSINETFYFESRHGINVLRGHINFANHIGWFRLPLRFSLGGKAQVLTLSFEVWPTKMDMTTDLNRIYLAIDQLYPLWRFALAEKTEQNLERTSTPHQPHGLLWLAQFESLRDSLERSLKLIINAPHSRLLSVKRTVKAEQFKAKMPAKRAEQIRTDQQSGVSHHRYDMAKKVLSVDTPENRFIKMVLDTTIDKLGKFSKAARQYNQAKQQPRLSEVFFDKLNQWRQPLERYRNHALFKEVGAFAGLSNESLVLQQKAGYSQVYRVWHMLSMYLNTLGSGASISMKSLSQLYELWCFLAIKQILLQLGFVEIDPPQNRVASRKLELRSSDGFCGAFVLKRRDGVTIELTHQPRFNEQSYPVRAWDTTQIPDILMKANFANGESLSWVFDAKYRIDSKTKSDGKDRVPEDAINQMHRYNDALKHMHKTQRLPDRSRALLGAFALYPGLFADQRADNCEQNPFYENIADNGIGAFPFLPSDNSETDNAWLRQFLTDKFGVLESDEQVGMASADDHFVDPANRIVNKGLEPLRYRDLCLIATTAEDEREPGYYERFEDGTAQWFHMKLQATERDAIDQQVIMNELSFCVVAAATPGDERKAHWVWHVRSATVKARSELTLAQTGKSTQSQAQSQEQYWLFELDRPTPLHPVMTGFAKGHHHIKLSKLQDLDDNANFGDLVGRYPGLNR